jgi:hypothetical protein
MIPHSVCHRVEEFGYLLFAFCLHVGENFVEEFGIVPATCFEDLFFGRGSLESLSVQLGGSSAFAHISVVRHSVTILGRSRGSVKQAVKI